MNYKIKPESYRKETTTNLLIKAKADCVQKAARPATRRSQLSTEHFPWRPQQKLARINQWRVHLSVHQSWESQCLQAYKYGYNTVHGARPSERQLRSPADVRDPESLTEPWLWFPESASISRWCGSKGLDCSGKKTPSYHLHCVNLVREKNAIIQSFTNSNCETLLMRKDTRLHVQDTMCFC